MNTLVLAEHRHRIQQNTVEDLQYRAGSNTVFLSNKSCRSDTLLDIIIQISPARDTGLMP